jgi:MoxR-like ATPase
VLLGASARASLTLLHAAKAHGALAGRNFVTPDDIQAVAVAALSHRLMLTGGTDLQAATALVRRIVDALPVPRA